MAKNLGHSYATACAPDGSMSIIWARPHRGVSNLDRSYLQWQIKPQPSTELPDADFSWAYPSVFWAHLRWESCLAEQHARCSASQSQWTPRRTRYSPRQGTATLRLNQGTGRGRMIRLLPCIVLTPAWNRSGGLMGAITQRSWRVAVPSMQSDIPNWFPQPTP